MNCSVFAHTRRGTLKTMMQSLNLSEPRERGMVEVVASQPEHGPVASLPKAPAKPAPATAAPAPQPVSGVASPPEVFRSFVDAAVYKHTLPLPKFFLMGVASGLFIGLGFSTCMLVGGNLSSDLRKSQPGLFYALYSVIGFPLGLILITFCGGDLWTGNCCYSMAAFIERRLSFLGLVRQITVTYFANLVGCLIMVGLFSGGHIWNNRDDYMTHAAVAKCSLPFGVALVRGIIGNMLVCLAVWLGNASRDGAGRIIGIYLPIMSFTSIGLEHAIANMYLIPMAILQGADITVGGWIRTNLIAATIGNWIGGAIMVGVLFSLIHGETAAVAWRDWERREASVEQRLQGCLRGREPSVGEVHTHQ